MKQLLNVVVAAISFAVIACADGSPSVQEPEPQPKPDETVALVEISGAKPMQRGETVRLSAVLRNAIGTPLSGKSVQWESSDLSSATVSSAGDVTAVAQTGTPTIKATSEGTSGTVALPIWWLYRTPVRYNVGQDIARSMTVNDAARGRSIPIWVWIPPGAPQPLPVVVLAGSALAGGFGAGWPSTYASAGYAVIQMSSPPANDGTCREFNVPESECAALLVDQSGPTGSPIVVLKVARDVSTVLDQLASIGSLVGAQFDATRVAVSGVSRGAAVVLALAGATVDLSATVKNVSVRDMRPVAFVANSPPGTTSTGPSCGCTVNSWQSITVPTLIQTGSSDVWGKREPFDRIPAGDKYLAFYDTPTIVHISFSLEFSAVPGGPGPVGQFITPVAEAFLDAYMRDKSDARAWLRSNELARGTSGVVQLTSK